MFKTTQHLNDEHMRLYEWSGAGAVIVPAIPAKSKRTHSWHASYDVLALLTSLLILNGCDNKGPAEQAEMQVDQAAKDMKEETRALNNDGTAASPGPAEEAGRTLDEAREQAGEKVERLGEDMQKP
jgi:hypothetical protein